MTRSFGGHPAAEGRIEVGEMGSRAGVGPVDPAGPAAVRKGMWDSLEAGANCHCAANCRTRTSLL